MAEYTNLTLDMGTSGWKVKYQKLLFYLLSLIARGGLREKANGIFEADYSKKSVDNIALNTDLGRFYVGNIAKRSIDTWSGYGKERYTLSEFMIPMTLAAMSEAKPKDDLVVITTAVPAKWIESTVFVNGQDVPLVDVITNHFQGQHVIDREDRRGQQVVNVTDVNILTETKGLLYSFLLDEAGNETIDDIHNTRIAVADIGELTSCLDIFKGLERERESATLTDVSMGQVHKAVADKIYNETGRTVEPWQIRDIVRDGGYIMLPATARQPAKRFDIMPIYKEKIGIARQMFQSHFADFITSQRDIHYILVGGGGSETIGQALKVSYRQAKILGLFATVQGMNNHGELLCKYLNQKSR